MTQRFELGDTVVFSPWGGDLRRGRVMGIAGTDELSWLTVDTGEEDGEVQVSSHAAYLVGSERRRFLDDVIFAVVRELTSAHIGVALDRFWLDAWEADPDGERLDALKQAEALVRTNAKQHVDELVKLVLPELEALFTDLPEKKQVAVWNVSRAYWFGQLRWAKHSAEKLRESLLSERWPERSGDEAYQQLIDQTRALREKSRA
ncbi:MAG: hypothetical protein ACO1OB_17245 [Archangium sp.]